LKSFLLRHAFYSVEEFVALQLCYSISWVLSKLSALQVFSSDIICKML
jgi:hypothetical protein